MFVFVVGFASYLCCCEGGSVVACQVVQCFPFVDLLREEVVAYAVVERVVFACGFCYVVEDGPVLCLCLSEKIVEV